MYRHLCTFMNRSVPATLVACWLAACAADEPDRAARSEPPAGELDTTPPQADTSAPEEDTSPPEDSDIPEDSGAPLDTGGAPATNCAKEDLTYRIEARDATGVCTSCTYPFQTFLMVDNTCANDVVWEPWGPTWTCLVSMYGWQGNDIDMEAEALPYCYTIDQFVVPAGGSFERNVSLQYWDTGNYDLFVEVGTIPFTYVVANLDVTVP